MWGPEGPPQTCPSCGSFMLAKGRTECINCGGAQVSDCYCGHSEEEHPGRRECEAKDCPCIQYERNRDDDEGDFEELLPGAFAVKERRRK